MIESTITSLILNNNNNNIANSVVTVELDSSVQTSWQSKVDDNDDDGYLMEHQKKTLGIEKRIWQDVEGRDDIENDHQAITTTTPTAGADFCWSVLLLMGQDLLREHFQRQQRHIHSPSDDDDDDTDDDDEDEESDDDDYDSDDDDYENEVDDESAMEGINPHSIRDGCDYDDESSCTTVPFWIRMDANESVDVMDYSLFTFENDSVFLDWWDFAAAAAANDDDEEEGEEAYHDMTIPEWISVDAVGSEVESVGDGSLFSFGDESLFYEFMVANYQPKAGEWVYTDDNKNDDNNDDGNNDGDDRSHCWHGEVEDVNVDIDNDHEEGRDDVDVDDDEDDDSSSRYYKSPPAFVYIDNDHDDGDQTNVEEGFEYDVNDDDSLFTFEDKHDRNLFFGWVAAAKNRMLELEEEEKSRREQLMKNQHRHQQWQWNHHHQEEQEETMMMSPSTKAALATKDITLVRFLMDLCSSE